MSDNKGAVKLYLGDISSALTCSRSMKKVFMREFRPEVEEFAAGRENLTVEALCARFGSPEDVADGFAERDDYKALLKKAKKRTVILAVIIVLLLVVLSFSIWFALEMHELAGHHIVVSNAVAAESDYLIEQENNGR